MFQRLSMLSLNLKAKSELYNEIGKLTYQSFADSDNDDDIKSKCGIIRLNIRKSESLRATRRI